MEPPFVKARLSEPYPTIRGRSSLPFSLELKRPASTPLLPNGLLRQAVLSSKMNLKNTQLGVLNRVICSCWKD